MIIIDVIYMIDVILSFFTGTIDTTVNPPKVGLLGSPLIMIMPFSTILSNPVHSLHEFIFIPVRRSQIILLILSLQPTSTHLLLLLDYPGEE